MDNIRNRASIFFAGSALAVILGFTFFMNPPANAIPDVVAIRAGEGIREVGRVLHERRLIRSRAAFSLYAIISGSAHQLKPGSYRFEGNLGIPATIRQLVEGPAEAEVLIVEGDTLKDVETKLVARALISPGALTSVSVDELRGEYPFLGNAAAFEGFLFPDTYRVTAGAHGITVLRKFLDNFRAKVAPHTKDIEQGTLYRDLIIASLIEREVPGAEDRRLVSGIMKRRLAIGMPLQVDATVSYAKCAGAFQGCPPLTRADFSLKSVFNTYVVRGLPPAPIANPGLDSIVAARSPRISSYLYYLSDPATGKTVFAETLEQHNENRARYLKR
ncbi:MAG: endolytic transglycosylase MltG [Patescibacteria group bacterium]